MIVKIKEQCASRAVSADKGERLCKCSIVSIIDGTLIGWKGCPFEKRSEQTSIVRIPSTGHLICLLDRRLG
jgi:hypothetical protein